MTFVKGWFRKFIVIVILLTFVKGIYANEEKDYRIRSGQSLCYFGMFIVNFNIVFGKDDDSFMGRFLTLFSGHSSTVFVMLAGMGVALMTNRTQEYTAEDRKRLRATILEACCFPVCFGVLFYLWWPADILHLYGGYMSIGALLVFMDKSTT